MSKFHKLLDKAISSPSVPQKQAKNGGYSEKKTRSHKTGDTLKKRSGKSRPKNA